MNFDIPAFEPAAYDIRIPGVGFGTWGMGEDASARSGEVAALRRAIDRGFTHFDTAEMYAEGGAEAVLGEAIAGHGRDGLFLTSKVYPWNADPDAMTASCNRSLDRCGTDYFDLYLLHWKGNSDMEAVLDGAQRLVDAGKIRAFGVSNFDIDAMRDLGNRQMLDRIAANQVMHNIANRGPEFDLFPFMRSHDVAAIAYSPLETGPVAQIDGMEELAAEAGLSIAQLSLAWHVTLGLACAIPKSASIDHVDELADAATTRLDPAIMQRIDALAPVPDRPQSLAIR